MDESSPPSTGPPAALLLCRACCIPRDTTCSTHLRRSVFFSSKLISDCPHPSLLQVPVKAAILMLFGQSCAPLVRGCIRSEERLRVSSHLRRRCRSLRARTCSAALRSEDQSGAALLRRLCRARSRVSKTSTPLPSCLPEGRHAVLSRHRRNEGPLWECTGHPLSPAEPSNVAGVALRATGLSPPPTCVGVAFNPPLVRL